MPRIQTPSVRSNLSASLVVARSAPHCDRRSPRRSAQAPNCRAPTKRGASLQRTQDLVLSGGRTRCLLSRRERYPATPSMWCLLWTKGRRRRGASLDARFVSGCSSARPLSPCSRDSSVTGALRLSAEPLLLPPSGGAAARAALPAVSAGSVGFESPSMVLGARAIRGRQRKDDSSSDLGPKAGLCARTSWQSDAIRRIRRTGRPDEGPSSLSWPSCVQPQAPCGLTPDLGSSASCTAPPWMYRCNAPSTRPGASNTRRRVCLQATARRSVSSSNAGAAADQATSDAVLARPRAAAVAFVVRAVLNRPRDHVSELQRQLRRLYPRSF
jgi:hypothetical protein